MRLSDVQGERTFDVLAEIFDSVADIAKDQKVMNVFRKRKLPKGMSRGQMGAQVAIEACDVIIKYHKVEIEKICASLSNETVEEYVANVNGISLIQDVYDLLADPELQNLFLSQVQSGETDSGSASENTEGQDN